MASPAHDAVLTAYAQKLIRIKARQLVKKPTFTRSDEADIAQELVAALIAKAHLFDPARGSANTFADRVVHSAIRMMWRDRRRLKRAAGFRVLSIDHTDTASHPSADSPRDLLTAADLHRRTGSDGTDERAAIKSDVGEVLPSLPPDLRAIAHRLMNDPPATVARAMGVSRRQLAKCLAEIRRRFEAAGFQEKKPARTRCGRTA